MPDATPNGVRAPGTIQVPVPGLPSRHGPFGIRYDFNEGCRVSVPPGQWRVRLSDLDTATVLFDAVLDGSMVASNKKYHIRFGIEVWRDGHSVFRHEFDAAGQDVLARMEVGGLGDQIAWLGHAVAFARKHGARLTCAMQPYMLPLFRDAYPDVRFQGGDEVAPDTFYATYKLFIFYNDHDHAWQPIDYRQAGLVNTAAYILGLPPGDERPRITIDGGGPPIEGRYVCIATQATSQNKYWNNHHGWDDVIAFLKAAGYRVVCIDRERVNGDGMVWNHVPHGAEDETGARPLTERARWLRHAEFFIGLSSGLSWLAWAAGCPVVLISGFTTPINEFQTPHRVINFHACNGCSNDIRHRLDVSDFLWCPRLKGTDRMFECTALIAAEQVKAAIRAIPGFGGAPGRAGHATAADGPDARQPAAPDRVAGA